VGAIAEALDYLRELQWMTPRMTARWQPCGRADDTGRPLGANPDGLFKLERPSGAPGPRGRSGADAPVAQGNRVFRRWHGGIPEKTESGPKLRFGPDSVFSGTFL